MIIVKILFTSCTPYTRNYWASIRVFKNQRFFILFEIAEKIQRVEKKTTHFTRRRSRHAGKEMLVVYDDERLSKEDVVKLEKNFTTVGVNIPRKIGFVA